MLMSNIKNSALQSIEAGKEKILSVSSEVKADIIEKANQSINQAKHTVLSTLEEKEAEVIIEVSAMQENIAESLHVAKNIVEETVTKENIEKAVEHTVEVVKSEVVAAMAGLDELEVQVADHYISLAKYGLAGTDGTKVSNYRAYVSNHHEIISICYANNKNPLSRTTRFFSLWNKTSLSFFLSVIFALLYVPRSSTYAEYEISILISLTLTPYSMLLNALATCALCHRKNTCVKAAHKCGSFLLAVFFVCSLGLIVTGLVLVILCNKGADFCHDGTKRYVVIENFFLSLFMDALYPLILGKANFCVYSWSGVLCCPIVACHCPKSISSFIAPCCKEESKKVGDETEDELFLCKFPSKYSYLSMLTFFPIRFVLNMYYLAESTYEDDKVSFQSQYPDRIAIDVFKSSVAHEYNTTEFTECDDENVV